MTTVPGLSELAGDHVLDRGSTRIGFIAKHAIGTRARGRFDEFAGGARLEGDGPRLNVDAYPVMTFTSITADLAGEAQLERHDRRPGERARDARVRRHGDPAAPTGLVATVRRRKR